jgi:isopenicillin-N epimerase
MDDSTTQTHAAATTTGRSESRWREVRRQFLIPAEDTYLNNGSFGPAPRPVLDAVTYWMEKLEANPTMRGGMLRGERKRVKEALGGYMGMQPADFVFVTNVTVGMNIIARGLQDLKPGDEVLTTDQEYGAVRKIWDFVSSRRGATIRTVELPTPPKSSAEIVECIESGITDSTRILVFSHITTTTGLVMPVREICDLARRRGVLTAVDGAHAPGMIPLDVASLGCDYYTGNCHKWLCAPNGTGFLWVAEPVQPSLDPLIVSWGWKEGEETFLGNFEDPGTHSLPLTAAVGAAVSFQREIGPQRIAQRGSELATYARERLLELDGVTPLTATGTPLAASMAAYRLPKLEGTRLQDTLREQRIAIPASMGDEGGRIRVSTHLYNSTEDVDTLVRVLRTLYG